MVKQILSAAGVILFLSSCSTSFKPLNFTSSKQVTSITEPVSTTKFIDNITVEVPVTTDNSDLKPEPEIAATGAGGAKVIARPAAKQEATENRGAGGRDRLRRRTDGRRGNFRRGRAR